MSEGRYELSAYIGPCTRDEAEELATWILEESWNESLPDVVAVGVRPITEDDPRFAEAVA